MSLPAELAVLASDSDRDDAARVLTEAFAAGRLTAAEHGDRVHAVYRARTWPELAKLTADLPEPAGPPAPDWAASWIPACWSAYARRLVSRCCCAAAGCGPEWCAVPKIAEQARAARREQIISAGLVCFARDGYHTATMADVAAQAGVSKGTPYLYFASKEALFLALHEEWDCGAGRRIDAAVAALPEAGRHSPRQVLHAIAAGIAAHVQAEPDTCRVLMEARSLAAHEPAVAAAVRAGDARSQQRLEELITAGVQAGEWPPGTDPALSARLFTAGLYGLMAQWHLAPGSFSWDAAVAALAGPAS